MNQFIKKRELKLLTQIMMGNYMVSISCITFNHERFIRQCIEGFIMQQTSFEYEILIHDDASTDNTVGIIKEYEKKYPDLIKPIYQTENQYSKGANPTIDFNLPRAKGEYIALCEGDDYWTDPFKLQKQIDFLEKHREYVISYHNAKVVDKESVVVKESKLPDRQKTDRNELELQKGFLILTLTMCFRNVIKEFPEEFYKVKNGDTFLVSLLGNYGKGKYLENIQPSCYRIHEGGRWSSSQDIDKHISHANTFYYLFKYHSRIGNKEIAAFYKRKSASKYKTVTIMYLKAAKYLKSLKYFIKMFK